MAKPEIKMEISEKDKKLLLVLASVLIVALAYYFGYQKFTKQEKLYQEELAAAQAKEADLMEKAENIEDYIADTETYKKEFEEILGQYGSAITLPSNVDFINKAERATDVWMKSVAFSGTSPIYTFGQKLSSNPDYAEDLAYRTDMVGYKTTLSVAYEGEYAQWKELLKYINAYYSKNAIENISMAYSNITGQVSGTMSLALYSIIGDEKVEVQPEFDIQSGSENIFESGQYTVNSMVEDGNYILADYDYYLLLNAQSSSMDSCIVGQKGDKESEISTNENNVQNVKLNISGEQGSYTMEYSIGGNKQKKTFEAGNTMDLLVMSSPRISDEDLAGVSLSVNNTSDMEFHIKVFNDDAENSRVKFESTEGNVVVY